MNYKLLIILLFATLKVSAQNIQIIRGDCTPPGEGEEAVAQARGMAPRRLPPVRTQWDASKTYRQLVVLVSFSDTDFQTENPQETYDAIFNGKGYNQRQGKGSVADYFREQSGGKFNLYFDVYGPMKVSSQAQPSSSPTSSTRNYGATPIKEATNMLLAAYPNMDYTVYDWNGDGTIEQVVYVFAGYSGNEGSEICYGYLWPNTSTFSTITTPDGRKITNYSASAERWSNNTSCGIGTICHEFTHSLGLPDLYPASTSIGLSVVDEWDLMDGGNFTNFGWCPPNYSAMEKMLLGWITPVELTEPANILNMKPVSRSGEVYQVKHTDNEYLLLENRQWEGWDLGLPGKGLAIFHVNYDGGKWSGNSVNNVKNKWNYDLVHADEMDFVDWGTALGGKSSYIDKSNMLNNRILSSSPYPWITDYNSNTEYTDESSPSMQMFNNNSHGSKMLSKPITRICQNADGTVSFCFMGGVKVKGDVDDDKQLTIDDIVGVTNIIALGGTDEQREAADMNGDGEVNVADIILLQTKMIRVTLPVGQKETTDCY